MTTPQVKDLFQLLTPVTLGSLSTQEILTRLKFIGTLQPGEKLNVGSLRIESNSYLAPIMRYLKNESRQETYNFIYTIIEQAFMILFTLAPSNKISDTMVCNNILDDLHRALQGIMSLQETYKDDKMFLCELSTLIMAVQSKITEAKQKFPEIGTPGLTHCNLPSAPPAPPTVASPSTAPSAPTTSVTTSTDDKQQQDKPPKKK